MNNSFNEESDIFEISRRLKTEFNENLQVNIVDLLFQLIELMDVDDEIKGNLHSKALSCQDKISMMHYAYGNALKALHDFEATQNMDIPALYGNDEMEISFYTESMIIFARTALDVIATILFQAIFDKRGDSFNKFSKAIKKDINNNLSVFKAAFSKYENTSMHAYLLLCGSEKGRALRDQLIHQTTVKLQYDEYGNGEKEQLYIILNKDEEKVQIPYKIFCHLFVLEVDEIVFTMAHAAIDYVQKN